VFNPGEPVYGTTSPLWSLGLGALGKSGIDLLLLAHVVAAAAALGSVVAFAVFLRRFMDAWVDESATARAARNSRWALAFSRSRPTRGSCAGPRQAWRARSDAPRHARVRRLHVAPAVGPQALAPTVWWTLAALARPEAALLLLLLAIRAGLGVAPPYAGSGASCACSCLRSSSRSRGSSTRSCSTHGRPRDARGEDGGGGRPARLRRGLVRAAKALAGARAVELVLLVLLVPSLVARAWSSRAEHFVPVLWLVGLPLLYAARGVPVLSRYMLPVARSSWPTRGRARDPCRGRAAASRVCLCGARPRRPGERGVGGRRRRWPEPPQGSAFARDVRGSLLELGRTCREAHARGRGHRHARHRGRRYAAERPVSISRGSSRRRSRRSSRATATTISWSTCASRGSRARRTSSIVRTHRTGCSWRARSGRASRRSRR